MSTAMTSSEDNKKEVVAQSSSLFFAVISIRYIEIKSHPFSKSVNRTLKGNEIKSEHPAKIVLKS